MLGFVLDNATSHVDTSGNRAGCQEGLYNCLSMVCPTCSDHPQITGGLRKRSHSVYVQRMFSGPAVAVFAPS